MNWINNLFKNAASAVSSPHFWGGLHNLSTYNFGSGGAQFFVKSAYACNPFVYMVTDKIADIASALPRYTVDVEDIKLESEDRFLELVDSVKVDINGERYIDCDVNGAYHKICTSLLVTGNAFVQIIDNGNQIHVRLAQHIEIVTTDGTESGDIAYYEYCSDGVPIRIPKNEMLHIKYPNIIEDTHWGLSPLQAFIYAVETSNNAFEAMAWMLKNKGGAGILSSKDANMPSTPSQVKEMTKAFKDMNGGGDKFQQVTVTSGAYDYMPISMNATDLKSLETNDKMLRVICSAYGVSSQLFNDTANSTYNNVSEAKKAMYTEVVKPLTTFIDECLSSYIYKLNGDNDNTIFTDFSGVKELANDVGIEVETISSLIRDGIISTDEGRTILIDKGVLNLQLDEEEESAGNSEDDIDEAGAAAQEAKVQAQANLRGSVGGVQGILAIQTQVSAGITSADSAIATLEEIYGFDTVTARRILGI